MSPIPPLTGTHETVADALEAAATQFADAEAFVEGGRRLTFAEWNRAADGVAAAFVDRDVRPGDVVAVLLPSSIDYAIAHAAIAKAGAVATGLNLRLGQAEVDAILDATAPALVVVDPVTVGVDLPPEQPVFLRDEIGPAADGPALEHRPECDASDPAVIIWTSGTTGVPKGAWFDHRNLAAAVASAGVMSRPFDRKLVATPFPHAGYMAKIWDQLSWVSCNVISPTPWRADDMLRLLVDEAITVAGGVPTQWVKLLELPATADADLAAVRIGLVATAPASPDLIERVSEVIGCPLVVRYAMTESPSITGTEPHDLPEVLQHTVGRPQHGMTVEIVDASGAPVPRGEIGNVRVRGACVMRGYWNAPDLTAQVLDEGWLTGSDLARFDTAGNLVLVGRADDMYIRGGYNVYPLEVENILNEHADVARAAVVGTSAPTIGEIGVAFVEAADPADPPTLDELRRWVADRLADYKAPDRLVVLDALPLTAMMKIDKVALARRAVATTDDRLAHAEGN